MAQVSRDIRGSIQYALDHRSEAIDYAIQFSRGLDLNKADRFIGMYVNELTLDYGEDGRQAVRLLLSEAHKKNIIPKSVDLEFV
jgi:1,4-dihydroxy-6-naphthoate synthase